MYSGLYRHKGDKTMEVLSCESVLFNVNKGVAVLMSSLGPPEWVSEAITMSI